MLDNNRVSQLFEGGEWACSWGDSGGLAAVCQQLANVSDSDLAERALRVLELLESAAEDAAFHAWAELTAWGHSQH